MNAMMQAALVALVLQILGLIGLYMQNYNII